MPPKRARHAKQPPPRAEPTRPKSTRAAARKSSAAQASSSSDADIISAFQLFAVEAPDDADVGSDDEDDDEGLADEGVIPIADVRRCLAALDLPKPPPNFFPKSQTHLSASNFLALAKTLQETGPDSASSSDDDLSAAPSDDSADDDSPHTNLQGDYDDDGEAEEEPVPVRGKRKRKPQPTKAKSAKSRTGRDSGREVDAAFALFTHDRSTESRSTRITLADLRRIARELREDVDDNTLRLMIEEANGEAGRESVGRGVGREEFESVMRRAGVFG